MWGLLRTILMFGNVLLLGVGRGEDRLSVYGLTIYLALNLVYLILGDQLFNWRASRLIEFDAKENELSQRADPKMAVLLRIILLIGNASLLALLAYVISYKYTTVYRETYGLLIFLALNFVYLLLGRLDAKESDRHIGNG
jgi:uncharacterized membrane protein